MRFSIERNAMMESLQLMMGVVERRQAVPVLSHLLLHAADNTLTIVGSDQEMEIVARLPIDLEVEGEMTLPARKLFDICRNLVPGSEIGISGEGLQAVVSSSRFRSQLKGLPVQDFPQLELPQSEWQVSVESSALYQLISKVEFAMAHQDVRYFFNGMLLDLLGGQLIAVATNGQRLARSEMLVETHGVGHIQAIVPRKAVAELLKLTRLEGQVGLTVTNKHIRFDLGDKTLTTTLIDAAYPDYQKAIPRNGDKSVFVDREAFRRALVRMAIVSNELYRNVRLALSSGQLQLSTSNSSHEEAEETLDVSYEGELIEIGFNVGYLIEVLSALRGELVQMSLSQPGSAVLFQSPDDGSSEYVVSPMVI